MEGGSRVRGGFMGEVRLEVLVRALVVKVALR